MSVTTVFYTVYGVKIPFDDALHDAIDERYDDLEKGKLGIDIIVDGMCGEYMVIGRVLARLYDGDEEIVTADCNANELYAIEAAARYNFESAFPNFYGPVLDGKPFKLISFVHYS